MDRAKSGHVENNLTNHHHSHSHLQVETVLFRAVACSISVENKNKQKRKVKWDCQTKRGNTTNHPFERFHYY